MRESYCQNNEFRNNAGCNYPESGINNDKPPILVFNIILLLSGLSIVVRLFICPYPDCDEKGYIEGIIKKVGYSEGESKKK